MPLHSGFDSRANALLGACYRYPADLCEIESLLRRVDVNRPHGAHPEVSILSALIENYAARVETGARCHACPPARDCRECGQSCRADAGVSYLPEIVDAFLRHGFDTYAYGAACLRSLKYSTAFDRMLAVAKAILSNGVCATDAAWRNLRAMVAYEADRQRSGEANHAQENYFFVLHEILRAYEAGDAYQDIYGYKHALGRTITEPVAFCRRAEDDRLFVDADTGDLCFTGGLRLPLEGAGVLFILDDPRLACMPESPAAWPKAWVAVDLPLEGPPGGFVGQAVMAFDFGHHVVRHGTAAYAQPILRISLSGGDTLVFTTNFGEAAREDTRCLARVETAVG